MCGDGESGPEIIDALRRFDDATPATCQEYTNGGLIPYASDVALDDADWALIGTIGVSGGLPAQDGEVARAAAGEGRGARRTHAAGCGSRPARACSAVTRAACDAALLLW
jgi:hypothetical protein